MSLTKKQLRELKKQLVSKNQNALQDIKNNNSKSKLKKKILKKDDFYPKRKDVIHWNYKTNDLVKLSYGDQNIGLIVSDFMYFSSKVEKNCFFVLIDSTVKQIDGKYLRQI